jgi:hypothetical protein
LAGLSAGGGEFEPDQGQEKKEVRAQNQEKMGVCRELGLAEARLASTARAQPNVRLIVADEWTVGDDVADRATVAGLVMAAEPLVVAEAV